MVPPYISEGDARLELGLNDGKWREFLQRSALTIYTLHGGARILKRAAFYQHIAQLIEQGGESEPARRAAPQADAAKDAA